MWVIDNARNPQLLKWVWEWTLTLSVEDILSVRMTKKVFLVWACIHPSVFAIFATLGCKPVQVREVTSLCFSSYELVLEASSSLLWNASLHLDKKKKKIPQLDIWIIMKVQKKSVSVDPGRTIKLYLEFVPSPLPLKATWRQMNILFFASLLGTNHVLQLFSDDLA